MKEEQKRAKALEKDLQKKEKGTGGSCGIITFAKKGPSDLGGRRGRMIGPSNRTLAVELNSRSQSKWCAISEGLSGATY